MLNRASTLPVHGTRPSAGSKDRAIDRWLLSRIARGLGGAPVLLGLRGGSEVAAASGPPIAIVRFRDRATLMRVARDPDLEFGEAYASGAVEVEGDLPALLAATFRAGARDERPRAPNPVASAQALRASRANVRHHYDLGNDFFRLWLDDEMVYTCAYFPEADAGLERAQRAKMDLVCRKLRLRPGERVVEAGCGWGALALYMARHHGATVSAYNLSHEQIRHARARAAEEGLESRVTFVEDDYRTIRGRYDVFVSIGMLEHVGLEHYAELGETIERSLDREHGRGLIHFIGRDRKMPLSRWILKRIFPGAYPPTLAEAIDGVLAPFGLSVLDVENLRPHYAKTLEHWAARYESAFARIAAQHGEEMARAWKLYLAGSTAAFRSGTLQLFQVLFGRSGDDAVPWRRAV